MQKVTLTHTEVSDLFDPPNPTGGGFQSLMSKLQRQCDKTTGEIKIDASDARRIPKYAFDYKQGGWENQLIRIFSRVLGPNLGR